MPHLPGHGLTAYLLNGGTLERAQAIAAHESPRTTKLYDRTDDEVTVEDIEKIDLSGARRPRIMLLHRRTATTARASSPCTLQLPIDRTSSGLANRCCPDLTIQAP